MTNVQARTDDTKLMRLTFKTFALLYALMALTALGAIPQALGWIPNLYLSHEVVLGHQLARNLSLAFLWPALGAVLLIIVTSRMNKDAA